MLQINNLTVRFGYHHDRSCSVSDVSLCINQGEIVALVGESGSGKSTIAMSILRILPKSATIQGQIVFNDLNLLALEEDRLQKIRGKNISMIFQEPTASLNPVHTIGQQIAEAITVHESISPQSVLIRVQQLLADVGLSDYRRFIDAYPHQLSGGQNQRAMIAIAIANKPCLLIADEPTASVDTIAAAQILGLLRQIQAAHKMSVLLITHGINVAARLANRIAVLNKGQIVECGETSGILQGPRHPYTRALVDAWCSMQSKRFVASNPSGDVVLCARNVKVEFPVKQGLWQRKKVFVHAVDNANIILNRGSTTGIIGESGSGKSSLALAILRLIPSTGSIMVLGQEIQDLSQRAIRPLRRHMQLVFQDSCGSLSPRLRVCDIIAEGLSVHAAQLSVPARNDKILAILSRVGLEEYLLTRYPHELSGGQRQRVAIARALIIEPKIVIFDESLSALDPVTQVQVLGLLSDIQKQLDLSYLFISHDLHLVRSIANFVVVMKDGQIIESADSDAMFSRPSHEYTKALIAAGSAL